MEEDTLQELRDIGEIQKVGNSDFVNQIYFIYFTDGRQPLMKAKR